MHRVRGSAWLGSTFRGARVLVAAVSAVSMAACGASMDGGGGEEDLQISGEQLTYAEVMRLAHDAGIPCNGLAVAGAIATQESQRSVRTVSSTGDYGLWQINNYWHAREFGVSNVEEYFDPVRNTAMMKTIYDQAGGWSPWVAYTSGAYRKYLDASQQAYAAACGSLGCCAPPKPACTPFANGARMYCGTACDASFRYSDVWWNGCAWIHSDYSGDYDYKCRQDAALRTRGGQLATGPSDTYWRPYCDETAQYHDAYYTGNGTDFSPSTVRMTDPVTTAAKACSVEYRCRW